MEPTPEEIDAMADEGMYWDGTTWRLEGEADWPTEEEE